MARHTILSLQKLKRDGEKIACLTAYDASFAAQAERAGVDVLLVGDSLGMVVQGQDSTLPVTLDEMIYHSASVRRGAPDSLLIVDLPFMSCNNPQQTLASAGRLMKEGGAHVVKLEGGASMVESVALLARHGIPVCGHLGLLPQSVHKLGGYRVQGRSEAEAERMLRDAQALEQAGADLLVVECVPAALGERLSQALSIPVIGIGAGAGCDGQVLVLYDMLGITPGKMPVFARNFLRGRDSVAAAMTAYVEAVKGGAFPAPEHGFD